MITRKKVDSILHKSITQILDEIYNSIGTCEKCKYYTVKDGYCYKLQIDGFKKDFYCKNFEKKKIK